MLIKLKKNEDKNDNSTRKNPKKFIKNESEPNNYVLTTAFQT